MISTRLIAARAAGSARSMATNATDRKTTPVHAHHVAAGALLPPPPPPRASQTHGSSARRGPLSNLEARAKDPHRRGREGL